MADDFDLSEAITLLLKHYPGKNTVEFKARYGQDSTGTVNERVRLVLNEAMTIEPDWNILSLRQAGDYVASVMRERHPDLSTQALKSIANYFTYLMR